MGVRRNDASERALAMKVGFIGLGRMGNGMAQRILAAGFPLLVWNRTRAKAEACLAAGATWAESPADLARQCDVIITCVSDTRDVEAVIFGSQGIAGAARPGTVIVDMSTISPVATREFAERLHQMGIDMLDAPVSGGSEGARKGTLSTMVGGDPTVLQQVRPVLSAMATTITHVGESGNGQATKMVNQVVAVGNILAMSEGLLLARRYGLDLDATLSAIQGGAAGSWMLSQQGPKVIAEDWSPSFTIELQLKDLRLVLEMADACGAPVLATCQIAQLYRSLVARGHSQEGNHALYRALEALIKEASTS